MKHKLLSILLLFAFQAVSAQPWMKQFENANAEPNFFDIKEAFEKYCEGKKVNFKEGFKPKENDELENEIPGLEQYKRWEHFYESRVDSNGNFPKPSALWEAYLAKKASQQSSDIDTANHGDWSLIGPTFSIPSDGGMGRINAITFDPQNPNIVWAGAPAGGLWKSLNGGTTWQPTSTDKLPVIGISDIAIHPTNSNIMYIATGDNAAQVLFTSSIGILKSTDGGLTWNSTGISYTVNQTRKINKLVINPLHPDTMLVATTNGVMVSSDAAATWTSVKTGAFLDIEFKPGNPDIVYISNGSNIFKSTDAGFNFGTQSLSSTFSSGVGRVELAVTADNPGVVYALCSSADGSYKYLYKSWDEGQTWTQMSSGPNILGSSQDGSEAGGNSWYAQSLAVSPTNENIVFVGGVNVWRSINGGNSFFLNAFWVPNSGAAYVHADIHSIVFKPQPAGSTTTPIAYIGCDGGVFKSTDMGNVWNDLSSGLQIMQLYKMSGSTTTQNLLVAGAQDNGTNLFTETTLSEINGGDGMDCQISVDDENMIFASSQNGNFAKSTDGGNNFIDITPSGEADNGPWVTAIAQSKSQPQNMYLGYKKVYQSNSYGDNWTSVTPSQFNGAFYNFIVVAPTDDNIVYASTNSRIIKSEDAGLTWSLKMSGSSITCVDVSEDDPNIAYATVSNYGSTSKVYRTVDGGNHWTSYTKTGLPAVPVNCVLTQKNNHGGVYVGTDFGVYYTDTTLTNWIDFNHGLPNTYVMDLDIFYPTKTLRAATYGRGIWQSKLNMDTLLSVKEISNTNSFEFFPNPANNTLTFRNTSAKNFPTRIEIISLEGTKVQEFLMTEKLYSKEINIASLASGTYILKVEFQSKTDYKKLIICHK